MSKRTYARFLLVLGLSAAVAGLVSIRSSASTSDAPYALSMPPFGTGTTVAVPPNDVTAMVSADFDQDGDPDLAQADQGGKVHVWENDGPFAGLWTSNLLEALDYPVYALVAGDLDNDGYVDLGSASDNGETFELKVWQNDGTPFAGTWTVVSAANVPPASSVTRRRYRPARPPIE